MAVGPIVRRWGLGDAASDQAAADLVAHKTAVTQSLGAPSTLDWDARITGFTVARTQFGRTIYFPMDALGHTLGVGWDASWRLVPSSSLTPQYPDRVTQGVPGELEEGASKAAPVVAPPPVVDTNPEDQPPPPEPWRYAYDSSGAGVLMDANGVPVPADFAKARGYAQTIQRPGTTPGVASATGDAPPASNTTPPVTAKLPPGVYFQGGQFVDEAGVPVDDATAAAYGGHAGGRTPVPESPPSETSPPAPSDGSGTPTAGAPLSAGLGGGSLGLLLGLGLLGAALYSSRKR